MHSYGSTLHLAFATEIRTLYHSPFCSLTCYRQIWASSAVLCSASSSSDVTLPRTGYLIFRLHFCSASPIDFETSRKKSDVSSISKTISVDWHSGQMALSTYSLFPEPGDLKKTCAIPNCAVINALIDPCVSSSANLLFGTPDTANTLRAKLPRWLHFEHRTGLSEPNFGIFIIATVSSSFSALTDLPEAHLAVLHRNQQDSAELENGLLPTS